MYVREIMSPKVEWVTEDITLQDAAKKMKKLRIGCLPVKAGKSDKLLGMITDRDITCRAVADGADPTITLVGEIMSKSAVYCFDDQDVGDAAQIMEAKKVHRLPVMDHAENMIGMLSLTDLALYASRDLSAEVLEAVSKYTH